jgi:radical SAM superfamily enzyme YgiQ (UPF0313 family)
MEGLRELNGSKRHVYFNEYNVRMGNLSYLPLVSGLLRAYAQSSDIIGSSYEFRPFIYQIDSLETILEKYTSEPAVAAFSVSMWNEQLNLSVAKAVKHRWPRCLIVFGGPQVPHQPTEYMTMHPFVDVAVRAEGEVSFSQVLLRFLESDDFTSIANVSFRRDGAIIVNSDTHPYRRELDAYPSPYLDGLYDDLLRQRGEEMDFQAIIETNRGCPFECTFCYWGRGGLSRKYRYHDLDRVFAEIDWCGRNKIAYVFNADSNFGMHRRDSEIADFIVQTKRKYGFPDKFRTCFGKNTDERIFQIGHLFHVNNLEKGITLARQSNHGETLANIKRSNIKMTTYVNLQKRFNEQQVPVYSELILGLPGETAESWIHGIDEMLGSGLKNQLFTYPCQIYPNTELAEPEYRGRFGIVTRRIELNEIHGSVRDDSWIKEYEDIVVQTHSMPLSSWRRMVIFSWVTMAMHSMKLGFFLLSYLRDRFGVVPSRILEHLSTETRGKGSIWGRELELYNKHIDDMLERGCGRGIVMRDHGDLYWDTEESTFLRASADLDAFYDEMTGIMVDFLRAEGIAFERDELAAVVDYQRARIPAARLPARTRYEFDFNLPDYFERQLTLQPVPLLPVPQEMTIAPVDFAGDKKRFARETILWGRKSGTMLVPVRYSPLSYAPASTAEPDSIGRRA